MAELKPCRMCLNARVDDELTDSNDLSFYGVGISEKGFRLLIRAGGGRPVEILAERWMSELHQWTTVAAYTPCFCPNCGREIAEYRRAGGE